MSIRTVEEQLALVLAEVATLPSERVATAAAAGRTTAAPVRAGVDIPVFENSAMDGFAVRFADVRAATDAAPSRLRVVADLPAGTAFDPDLGPGEAARIMTGSPVPTAADTVVPFEHTEGGLDDSLDEIAVLVPPPAPGAHVRRRASDLSAGDVVIDAGVLLGPLQIAAAAAAGVGELEVTRVPRVAVISTGDELVAPGLPLRRGQIPESNSILLAGLAAAAGADVVLRASVDDTDASLLAVLRDAQDAGADVVITSGGVSAGAYEVVKNALSGDIAFPKVAMQPGKPQGFGRLAAGPLLFALPGNPVSSAVSFEVFVRPALMRMLGRAALHRDVIRLPATTGWRTPPGRRQYLPASIDRSDATGWRVGPATAGGSGSHLAGGLARAEAYAVVPAEVEEVREGDLVDVMLIS
ncbi:molybdopterin molybdotransferase MoeA [Microbacterium sp. Clip185]|uniref:molybdopterin molybdotransferase MoeA n=1 Tax=Microbacterium sp. Clip185 TaxID=3025663 RepID=UPI0023658951|nr:gephyrin-like molybdotransferase Glp [Microbacterium sp. Clip185]WDG17349.1 molybdopterin molybdotransferase MoeA [Microbacterium sp. Clip185]